MLTANHAPPDRGKASHASKVGLLLTIATFVVLATAWNVLIPPFENLDELEHFEVVRHVASTGGLPIHTIADTAGYRVRQEASQPPLYYYLATGWVKLLALPLTPPDVQEVPAQAVACGSPHVPYNKATWLHNPTLDGPPWNGTLMTLHSLRFFSTLLQIATLCGVWALARRIHPNGPFPAVVVGGVAFNPQFLLLAAGVNNDNVVIPLTTWGLVLAYDLWDLGAARWRPIALGIVCGAAAWSKLSGLALLSVGGGVLLLRWFQRRSSFRLVAGQGMVVLASAAVIISPWLLRNVHLYGDPTALAPMLAKVGRRVTAIDWGEARLLVLSYWGQLPCTFYPRSAYWPYLILMAGGAAGIALTWRRMDGRRRTLLALCVFWLAVIIAAWVRWTSTTPASGGRLLFPAIAAASLLIVAGWHGLHRRLAVAWGALLPIWALVVLMAGPVPVLLPPVSLRAAPDTTESAPILFAEAIGLTDYSAKVRTPRAQCLLSARAYCGPALDLTFEWEALAPIDEDYVMVIQLVDAAPGSTDLRLNYNYWPGRGNLRTSIWPIGRVIHDRYLLPLPPYDGVTQTWDLIVAFVDPDTGERLPVSGAGVPIGEVAVLTRVRVPDHQPQAPVWANPATPVDFAGSITLIDAGLTRIEGVWQVRLMWESRAPIRQNVITFVHAYDTGGELIATGDGPPLDGAFPTSYWAPGDRVFSTHDLEIPREADVAYVAVGLYDGDTGVRVAASRDDAPIPNDAVIIWAQGPGVQ